MRKKLQLALFISGGGTTAAAILSACRIGRLSLSPILVIASEEGITGIDRVKNLRIKNLEVVVVDPSKCVSSDQFAEKLLSACQKRRVDLVGQYGWLPLTPKKFIDYYQGRIINQHPGPLDPPRPDFGGKGMYGRRVHCAILYFRRTTRHDFWTEATTHFITSEFDKGEVIKRQRSKILPTDTVEDLQKRVLPIEHEVQIEVLQDFVKGEVKVFHLSKPLIEKKEYGILEKAKNVAAILYPHG